eukprot:TRINITY_DN7020_c0_g1_i1.p1 TRINITY_DN7020_c0_g1~~TRINITY_DN7020_c0_g1_i1.p1  ORF type:complete len:162 (-),score=14.57 TRINITY_DN7020_c0_g1_i1:225-710(-)
MESCLYKASLNFLLCSSDHCPDFCGMVPMARGTKRPAETENSEIQPNPDQDHDQFSSLEKLAVEALLEYPFGIDSSIESANDPDENLDKICSWCGTQATSRWRNVRKFSAEGDYTLVQLCNACGLHFYRSRFKVVPPKRRPQKSSKKRCLVHGQPQKSQML